MLAASPALAGRTLTALTHAASSRPGLALADAPPHSDDATRLVVAAAVGIAAIIGLIAWAKLNPFLSLVIGSVALALVAGVPLTDVLTSFATGFGTTTADVGILVALGAVIGVLLTESGGAERIVDSIMARTGPRTLPWAMTLIAVVVGIPLFFEIGVVLLVPVVLLVARRAQVSPLRVGIPALAGLSVLHGLVPPHPGPLAGISALHADLGTTLALGLVVAVPTAIVSGPLLTPLITRWVPLDPPSAEAAGSGESAPNGETSDGDATTSARAGRPGLAAALTTVLLPVSLMLVATIAETALPASSPVTKVATFVGDPLTALLIAVLVGLATLGRSTGRDRAGLSDLVGSAFAPVASIILIVGAGGGFKQTLVDSGVADVLADASRAASLSPLLVAWGVAVLIRVATGSATVATLTAAGVVEPLTHGMAPAEVSLVVLAVGTGSLFLSHVNDAGFWLVKQYFGLSVGQTLRSWTVMECVVSVVGLVLVLLLHLVV